MRFSPFNIDLAGIIPGGAFHFSIAKFGGRGKKGYLCNKVTELLCLQLEKLPMSAGHAQKKVSFW